MKAEPRYKIRKAGDFWSVIFDATRVDGSTSRVFVGRRSWPDALEYVRLHQTLSSATHAHQRRRQGDAL